MIVRELEKIRKHIFNIRMTLLFNNGSDCDAPEQWSRHTGRNQRIEGREIPRAREDPAKEGEKRGPKHNEVHRRESNE